MGEISHGSLSDQFYGLSLTGMGDLQAIKVRSPLNRNGVGFVDCLGDVRAISVRSFWAR